MLVLSRYVQIRGRKREVERTRAESVAGKREGALQCWPPRDSSIQNMLSCSASVTGFKSSLETWIRSWLWLRATPLCTVLDKTYQLSRKIISHPLHCLLLFLLLLLLLLTFAPYSPSNYISFNQQETAASLYFAQHYQTKGSGDFAEEFNYSKAVLAPVVCAPWIHLLLRWPVNDLF